MTAQPHEVPAKFSYEVVKDRFYAGEYPRDLDETSSRRKIRSILDFGITDFVDLTEAGELTYDRKPLLPYDEFLPVQGIEHHRFPIPDPGPPEAFEQLHGIHETIERLIVAEKMVYVHCWGGINRTGIVVGSWFLYNGMSVEEAMTRFEELWATNPKSGWRNPHIRRCERFLVGYAEWRVRLQNRNNLYPSKNMKNDNTALSRAQGCLLGQCIGDALGQMVEFRRKEKIYDEYPDGVRDMANGGYWDTLAGQPTDDTEMALMLARSIIKEKKFDAQKALEAYRYWLDSAPFDCGRTTNDGLRGRPLEDSQANGSLMRISPLGVYGSRFELDTVADWAMQDSRLTHPNVVCQKAVAIFTTTIAEAIAIGSGKVELYENALKRAKEDLYFEKSIFEALQKATDSPADRFGPQQGWVLIAFQNAYYRLLHAKDTEQAIVETVNEGGDTDTNGAICGALVGAVYGVESIPERWQTVILNCRPSKDNPDARNPRPECFWPVDVLEIAEELLTI